MASRSRPQREYHAGAARTNRTGSKPSAELQNRNVNDQGVFEIRGAVPVRMIGRIHQRPQQHAHGTRGAGYRGADGRTSHSSCRGLLAGRTAHD